MQNGDAIAAQILTDFIADIYKSRTGNFISAELLDLIWSITVSIFAVGGMIGGLSGGTIADWCGRYVCDASALLSSTFLWLQVYGTSDLTRVTAMRQKISAGGAGA